jgi:hypothetical protein
MTEDKIKFKQLPFIVKIMVVFFVIGLVFKILLYASYLVIFLNDGNLDSVDFDKIEQETRKSLCQSQTNMTYLNYDPQRESCYTHICPEGYWDQETIYSGDLDKDCDYKSIPFKPEWQLVK